MGHISLELPQSPVTFQEVDEASQTADNGALVLEVGFPQTGTHIVPTGAPALQLPSRAPSGRPGASRHAEVEGTQVPLTDQEVVVQVAVRVPTNPAAQSGLQVVPDAAPLWQLPARTCGPAGRVAQPEEAQEPTTAQEPATVQFAVREPKKPALQAGVHTLPGKTFTTQSPGPPLTTVT